MSKENCFRVKKDGFKSPQAHLTPPCVSSSSEFSVPFFRIKSPLSPWERRKRRMLIPPTAETAQDSRALHKMPSQRFLHLLWMRAEISDLSSVKLFWKDWQLLYWILWSYENPKQLISLYFSLTFWIWSVMDFCKNSKRHSTHEAYYP